MNNAVTYGQLERALTKLGFTAQVSGDVTRFIEEDHDAIITVPSAASDGVVPIHYVLETQETVYWKGIAGRSDCERRLSKCAAKPS